MLRTPAVQAEEPPAEPAAQQQAVILSETATPKSASPAPSADEAESHPARQPQALAAQPEPEQPGDGDRVPLATAATAGVCLLAAAGLLFKYRFFKRKS